jgi:chorismate lyase / 3-hydroxybenzoate synthase
MSGESPALLGVAYRTDPPDALLARPGTLAVFGFGDTPAKRDPRAITVPLTPLLVDTPCEHWFIDAPVVCGNQGELRWSAGGGWRCITLEVEEAAGDIEAASEHAYRILMQHVAACPERHLQRIWNYFGAINEGEGDAERYRLFCNGRARGLAALGITRYPAATAIGHHGPRGLLQVYALCATVPGTALENPRQVSAWNYPRQYGPTAPNFARAIRLPHDGLAISGTAAVVGHASHHVGDVVAQADEAFANLCALLEQSALPAFDAHSPLKVYVRDPDNAAAVHAALSRRLGPAVPCILLHGDICRRELLVEIDGWRFASA